MKSKQQILAELNCAQKRLWRVIEELQANHKSVGTEALQSARGHISVVKACLR